MVIEHTTSPACLQEMFQFLVSALNAFFTILDFFISNFT